MEGLRAHLENIIDRGSRLVSFSRLNDVGIILEVVWLGSYD